MLIKNIDTIEKKQSTFKRFETTVITAIINGAGRSTIKHAARAAEVSQSVTEEAYSNSPVFKATWNNLPSCTGVYKPTL